MSAATVDAALAGARGAGLDRLDAQLLLGAVLGRDRSWLIAHGDDAMPADRAADFDALVARRLAGEPVAYLLGRKDFHGLALQVSPAVLVPRPDTETLVDWALELLGGELAGTGAPQVLDLGTGSGAIALAIKHRCPRADLSAVDTSPDALAVAAGNASALGLPLALLRGHWWAPVAGRRFDLVVSNPPYIAGDDHHLDALRHEPRLALTPGGDGLDSLREIIAGASAHLRDGSWLLLEHGHDQAREVQALLAAAGLCDVATRRDLGGHERCTGGRWRQATR
ncbi:peptide chain release factor N(5)-glutamine methyltransferase [Rhizobacter sp. SG703]|uniref:peptide chain release factor N(5)-glutamine methyltransferase n=1 Tax=Rhizobacter sp. SG703 TaxID=2587140 RepID=UPI001446F3BC|nr:release factor glutamine methyltransferase [Rhizobacter sp. SG703]